MIDKPVGTHRSRSVRQLLRLDTPKPAGFVSARALIACLVFLCCASGFRPAVSDATTWQQIERLNPDSFGAGHVQLAAAPDGAVTAVWPEDGTRSTTRSSAGIWGPRTRLTPSGVSTYYAGATVAVGSNGTAVATWSESDGKVAAAIRDPGGEWQPRQVLSPLAYPDPRAAVASDGTAVVVWHGISGSEKRYFATTRLPGVSTWQAPVALSGSDDACCLPPQIGIADNGLAIVAWTDKDSAVRTAVRSPKGVWSEPQIVVPPRSDLRASWALAVAPNSDAALTWAQLGGDGSGEIRGVFRPAAGSWSVPERLSSGAPGRWALDPELAAASDNSFTAFWSESGDLGHSLYSSRREPSSSWSPPDSIPGSGEAGLNSSGAVAVAADGAAGVAWEAGSFSGGNSRIMVATRVAGTPWQQPERITPPIDTIPGQTERVFLPVVVLDDQNRATVAWNRDRQYSSTHSYYSVEARSGTISSESTPGPTPLPTPLPTPTPSAGSAVPVVLVPGWLEDSHTMLPGGHCPGRNGSSSFGNFASLCLALKAAGHPVYLMGAKPGGSSVILDDHGAVGTNAQRLVRFMRTHQISQALIVGHSMGGLIARVAIARYHAPAAGLVTLGTPHDGSFAADNLEWLRTAYCFPTDLRCLAIRLAALVYISANGPAAIQDLTSSARSRDNARLSPISVPVWAYAGTAAASWEAPGYTVPNDSVVGQTSAWGRGAEIGRRVSCYSAPLWHGRYLVGQYVPNNLFDAPQAHQVVLDAALLTPQAARDKSRCAKRARSVAFRASATTTSAPAPSANPRIKLFATRSRGVRSGQRLAAAGSGPVFSKSDFSAACAGHTLAATQVAPGLFALDPVGANCPDATLFESTRSSPIALVAADDGPRARASVTHRGRRLTIQVVARRRIQRAYVKGGKRRSKLAVHGHRAAGRIRNSLVNRRAVVTAIIGGRHYTGALPRGR